MHNRFVLRSIAVILLLVTPAAIAWAETGAAMLYAKGNVLLNSVNVARSSALFPGDTVETATASAVNINQNGSTITLDPNSTMRYEKYAIDVMRGSARISTSAGIAAHVREITVSPKDKAAKYDVALVDNKITIGSREGDLLISDAGRVSTLMAGNSAMMTLNPADGQQAQTQNPPANPPSNFPTGGLNGPDRHGTWIIVGAIVAGAAVACGYLCGVSPSSVSPINP